MVLAILSRVRYVAYVAVIASAVSSTFMFFVGARRVYDGISHYLFGGFRRELPEWLAPDEIAGAEFIMSIDVFLLAMALLYFSFAIYFLAIAPRSEVTERVPAWLAPRTFGELKETLAMVIIVILMVLTLKTVLLELETLSWEILILPATILMLSVGLRAMNMRGK